MIKHIRLENTPYLLDPETENEYCFKLEKNIRLTAMRNELKFSTEGNRK
jgi:hypothetical protein